MHFFHGSARFRVTLTVAASLFALVGCRDNAPESVDAVVVRDSSGVAMVTSYRPQWPDGGGWQIDSVPRLSLGGAEADTNQHWRYIEFAAQMQNGQVILGMDGELRWFAADGVHLRTNRAGDGPGEFRYLGAMHVLPGDSLRVHDSQGLKYAVYAADGTLAYEQHTDGDKLRALGRWIECADQYLPDASRLLCQADASIPVTATNRPSQLMEGGITSPGPGLLRKLHRRWLVTPSLDTAYPLAIGAGIEQFGVADGGETRFLLHPFYSRFITASGGAPLRIATARNPDYRIELWTPDGALERVVTREGARRAPNARELADADASLRRSMRSKDPATVDRLIAQVPTPDSLPAIYGITLTPRGELLVLRERQLPSQAQSIYDVFDRDGVWLGTLRMRGRQSIVSVTDDAMLTVRRSEEDVILVEVYGYRR